MYEDDDDNPITLEDVVPDRTDEEIREFCERCFRNQRLYRCVWNIVEKLNEREQKLVDDIYIYDKSQTEIAEELGVSDSAVSQAHDRVLLHLTFYFYTDEEFQQMDLYKRSERGFKYDLERVALEIFKLSLEDVGIKMNLNDVRSVSKNFTQILKMASSLGIKLPFKQKKQMTFMNRKVKQGLDKLNLDWSKQNILKVPTDLKMPDNPEHMMNDLIVK